MHLSRPENYVVEDGFATKLYERLGKPRGHGLRSRSVASCENQTLFYFFYVPLAWLARLRFGSTQALSKQGTRCPTSRARGRIGDRPTRSYAEGSALPIDRARLFVLASEFPFQVKIHATGLR